MNDKEKRRNQIIDNSIAAYDSNRDEVFSHTRREDIHMAQVLVTCQLLDAGFLPMEIATVFDVSVATIRKRRYSGYYYHKFNSIYRIANDEATRLNKAV